MLITISFRDGICIDRCLPKGEKANPIPGFRFTPSNRVLLDEANCELASPALEDAARGDVALAAAVPKNVLFPLEFGE